MTVCGSFDGSVFRLHHLLLGGASMRRFLFSITGLLLFLVGRASGGIVYVANNTPVNTIVRLDTVSGTQTLIAQGGDFASPYGMAVGPDGQLYIADANAFDGPGGVGGAVFRVNPLTG